MTDALADPRRWRQLALLAAIELLAMALWFSASAVAPALQKPWGLSDGAMAWLTISVQLGFVIGALASAVVNLSDRIAPPRLLAACALAGAALNAAIPLLISDGLGRTTGGFALLLALRMATGVTLAGVYPTGMKLMATWFKQGRGLAIGVLVGALTIGSASPHLLAGQAPWRTVMLSASASAALAAVDPLPGRYQPVGAAGVTFIRDEFMASLWSIAPVLEFLRDARVPRKVLVLGTISDYSGRESQVYADVARQALEVADEVIFVGPQALRSGGARSHPKGAALRAFLSLRDAHRHLAETLVPGDLVLLKGSQRADHLLRLVLARRGRIACWRAECRRIKFCDDCLLLHLPEVGSIGGRRRRPADA